MRRTKIVATLGPASDPVIRDLIAAGVDVVRLNMSHGTRQEHDRRLQAARQAAAELGRPLSVMLDTRGPEVRLGAFRGGRVTLREGGSFTLTPAAVEGTAAEAHVNHPQIARDVRAGDTLLLDDGNLELRAVAVEDDRVVCRVVVGGVLSDHKKVNLPAGHLSVPYLGEADAADLRWGAEVGVDFVAASFVRGPEDVLEVRRVLEDAGCGAWVVVKIESQQGVDRLDAILSAADGLMVARGDLGVELPVETVPLLQKRMIRSARRRGRPVITATQMLESMVQHPRPTRAEATDVANAILDGTDAVMLSEETASGRHPVEAVRVMARLCAETEAAPEFHDLLRRDVPHQGASVTAAVSDATCAVAESLDCAAVITATVTGFAARMTARHRPRPPVIAVTPSPATARRLAVVWGVEAILDEAAGDVSDLFDHALEAARRAGAVQDGDLVVLTGGVPVGIPGTTNLLQVRTVGDALVRGQGLGGGSVTGRVVHLSDAGPAVAVPAGSVVVARDLEGADAARLAGAVALVVETEGRTGNAAIIALSLGLPAVVGAQGAMVALADGGEVTVDGRRGLVYRGRARTG
jgi:pyruvate kinase